PIASLPKRPRRSWATKQCIGPSCAKRWASLRYPTPSCPELSQRTPDHEKSCCYLSPCDSRGRVPDPTRCPGGHRRSCPWRGHLPPLPCLPCAEPQQRRAAPLRPVRPAGRHAQGLFLFNGDEEVRRDLERRDTRS